MHPASRGSGQEDDRDEDGDQPLTNAAQHRLGFCEAARDEDRITVVDQGCPLGPRVLDSLSVDHTHEHITTRHVVGQREHRWRDQWTRHRTLADIHLWP